MQPLDAHLPLLRTLAAFCAARGVQVWLVGGTLRDILLGRTASDLDLAVSADALELARACADSLGGAYVPLDSARGTARVVLGINPSEPPDEADAATPPLGRTYLDFAQLRAPSIEEDLRARDFTINALALPLHPSSLILHPSSLLDPCGGLPDLERRTLRLCDEGALRADPLRLLRAVRLAAQLGLALDPTLDELLRRDAPLIALPAAERVRDELFKLLDTPHSAAWLRYMDAAGLLTRIFPELEPARSCDQPSVHFLPVLAHSLETVAALEWILGQLGREDGGWRMEDGTPFSILHLPVAIQTHPALTFVLPFDDRLRVLLGGRVGGQARVALLKLAALLHDNAKPQTKQVKPDGGVSFYGHQELGADVARSIAQRLRLSRIAGAYVAGVVRAHMRPGQLRTQELTRRAVVRLFRDTRGAHNDGDSYAPDVLLHELADHMATRGPNISVEGWYAHLAWTGALLEVHWGTPPTQPVPLLDGEALMAALGIGPGPLVGTLLAEVREAQAAGEVADPEAALVLARRLYQERGV